MIDSNNTITKSIYVATLIGLLLTSAESYAEEKPSVSRTISESTRAYLADPARTGSLLGSIIAGSAVANPLAPVLGSVAGFLIGKSSAFSNTDDNASQRQDYNNRRLIPKDPLQVPGLAGLTGKPSQAAERAVDSGLSESTDAVIASQRSGGERPVILKMYEDTVLTSKSAQSSQADILELSSKPESRSNLQQQLADTCNNIELTQPISSSCYYYSQ